MEKENLYIFNFSKFIVITFVAIVLIGFPLNYLFEKKIIFESEISGASKVNRILNFNNLNEIPVFGSSRAEGSFIPSLINDSCFNYGISGTQSNIWLFFLKEELKKNKKTDIIINFDLNGLGYGNGNICNYIPNYSRLKKTINKEESYLFNIPLLKYFGHFEYYLKTYLNNKINLTKKTDLGGSFEKNVLTSYKFKQLINKRKESSTVFSLDNTLSIQLLNLLNSTNRKIVFVVAPYHTSYFYNFKNIEKVNLFLRELNNRNNVTVLDLRDFIEDDKLFLNTTHVNYDGALKTTNKIYEMLNDPLTYVNGFGPYLKE